MPKTRAAIVALWLGTAPAPPPERRARAWSNTADLSLVLAGGNSKTAQLALSDEFAYAWNRSELSLRIAALRTETTKRSLSNVGGEVRVEEVRSTTAESYQAAARYRHRIRKEFRGYAGVGWERNRLSGIDGRTTFEAGIGIRFVEDGDHALLLEGGASLTREDRVGGTRASFAGARAFLGYVRPLSATSKLTSDLEILENLDDTADWRAKSATALTASLTRAVALKLGYTVVYDNRPVVVSVADPTGANPPAAFEFGTTDHTVAASVVVNF